MIRRWLSHLPLFCSDQYFFLKLEGRESVAALFDLFRWSPAADTMTLRLTIHDRAALCAFINDGNAEFEVPRASVRAFAQYLLRRLREEGAAPVPASANHHTEEGETHAEKKDWRKNIYVQDRGHLGH